MNDYLREWQAAAIRRPIERLHAAVQVHGLCDFSFGGMRWYVRLLMEASPADEFHFYLELEPLSAGHVIGPSSVRESAFCLIDVLTTVRLWPVLGMRVRLHSVEQRFPHPSPPVAVRMAGRDAARRILEEEQRMLRTPGSAAD